MQSSNGSLRVKKQYGNVAQGNQRRMENDLALAAAPNQVFVSNSQIQGG